MKIIDLLNDISNSKEVPQTIKYRDRIFDYDDIDYFNTDKGYLFEQYATFEILNDKIEIIEEKKIPEKLDQTLNRNDIGDDYYKYIMENRFTINEIIDYLKSKGE